LSIVQPGQTRRNSEGLQAGTGIVNADDHPRDGRASQTLRTVNALQGA
jgi:hypothetical protein